MLIMLFICSRTVVSEEDCWLVPIQTFILSGYAADGQDDATRIADPSECEEEEEYSLEEDTESQDAEGLEVEAEWDSEEDAEFYAQNVDLNGLEEIQAFAAAVRQRHKLFRFLQKPEGHEKVTARKPDEAEVRLTVHVGTRQTRRRSREKRG